MSGVANMAKGISSLNRLRASIRDLPLRIRAEVATKAAGILTARLRDDFDSGRTVYGASRPLSVAGTALDLTVSGKTHGALAFVSVGTIVRAQLSTRYAKYLVGKYKILPSSLPAAWRVELETLVRDYVRTFEAEVSS